MNAFENIIYFILYLVSREKAKDYFSQKFMEKYLKDRNMLSLLPGGFKWYALKSSKNEDWIILWKDILDLTFSPEEVWFEHPKYGKQCISFQHDMGWQHVVLNIPSTVPGFNKDSVSAYLNQLSTCSVCGHVAMYEDDCRNCIHPSKIHHEDDAASQLRSEQLYHFCPEEENDPIDFFEKDEVFQLDPTWRPRVTEEEVRAYFRRMEYDEI